MASLQNIQQETVATIDTAKALTDKLLGLLTIVLSDPSLSHNFSVSPIGFLFQILKSLGVKSEKLEDFFIKLLVWVMPALEISAKAILLSNLKKMISCSIDPRIPEKFRKVHSTPTDMYTTNRFGIDIDIESIDMFDKLSINPLSEAGKHWYFGLQGIEDVYKFARADDFDAFLWFVIHKGKFPKPAHVDVAGYRFTDNVHGFGQMKVYPEDGTLLSQLELSNPENGSSKILPGNTFTYPGKSPHVMSMCIDSSKDEENNIVTNTLVPISDDRSSVNWYIRRADQLGKNLGWGWQWKYDKKTKGEYSTKERDFSKERAICNLQYMGMVDDAPITGLVNNKIRFTILPKPYIHTPDISNGEPPWRFKKMTFNEFGYYDPNGKYSFPQTITEQNTFDEYGNSIVRFFDGTTDIGVVLDKKSGAVVVEHPKDLIPYLLECYPGLTVYEFNYDYVMGMRLFDAKSLLTALIKLLTGFRVGVNIDINPKDDDFAEELREIIKTIVNTDDSQINNCYYSFDNSKYDALLQKTQEKKAKQQKFGNTTKEIGTFESVSEILAEYDAITDVKDKATEEDILHRAVTKTAAIISSGSNEEDRKEIEIDFVYDLIENLITAVVDALLSPKIMMLLEVNQQLMGGTWEKITAKDVLIAMRSIITALVKEIRDLILQELLKFTLEELRPLFETFSLMIVRERLEDIASAMEDIIRNCPFIWFRFGNQYAESKLDTVDYADIDVSSNKEGEQPSNINC